MQKLKTAILINSYILEAWENKIVEELIKSDCADISYVILDKSPEKEITYIKRAKDSFPVRAMEKLTSQGNIINPYNSPVDSSRLLGFIPVIQIERPGNHNMGDEPDNELLHVDVTVDLRIRKLSPPETLVSRYGFFRIKADYRLNDIDVFSDFWELVIKTSAVKMTLEIYGYGNREISEVFGTYESVLPFSQQLNRNIAYWRASLLIPRAIEGIYSFGESYLENMINRCNSQPPELLYENINRQKPILRLNNFNIFLKVLFKQISKKMFTGKEEEWQIRIGIQKDSYPSYSFENFKKLNPPDKLYWADPFVVRRESKYYIFVEELSFTSPNAHLAVVELSEKGQVLNSRKIMEKPYHMSYPFIFEYNDGLFMIPETSGNNSIDIYKCSEFPYKWEFYRTIMEGIHAVDTTLFHYNGKWWLFTSVDKTGLISGLDTELFIYYSDDPLEGKWESHPLNPVISDVRKARPAGNIYTENGKIYRPSQDCSGRYGRRFNINLIKKLSETDYEEEIERIVEPFWHRRSGGTHTFNFEGGLTVIDSYTYRKRRFLS